MPTSKHRRNVVDITKLVRHHFTEFLDHEQRRHADLKKPVILWNLMRVKYSPTKYTRRDTPKMPNTNVVFTATFDNTTPSAQTYKLRTKRMTTSTSEINLGKIFTYSGNVELDIKAPDSVVKANGGLKAEVRTEKSTKAITEHELIWRLDTRLEVEPGHSIRVEMVVQEDMYDGDFEMLTTFDGVVIVTYYDKKNNEVIDSFQDVVSSIFTPDKGFLMDNRNRPTFLVKGRCKCRYGVEQFVRVRESNVPRREFDQLVFS
ncbi:uncharacterized protein LOC131940584 [Physella acuta]|uniref:uncharacterized protein LOC131940584 n=1 Tax=Physella acuta TaxID=109671 RepID=UPI0027DAF5F8|nr:uncharacterized protein LOC131940584 [Physella acuta]